MALAKTRAIRCFLEERDLAALRSHGVVFPQVAPQVSRLCVGPRMMPALGEGHFVVQADAHRVRMAKRGVDPLAADPASPAVAVKNFPVPKPFVAEAHLSGSANMVEATRVVREVDLDIGALPVAFALI